MALTPTITREMVNSYSTASTGGAIPSNIYMRALPINWIDIIADPEDTPLVDMVMKGRKGGTSKYVELPYGEGDVTANETTLNGSYASTSADTVITLTAAIGQVWGQLINLDTMERLLIKDITGLTYTVGRGHGASSPAASSSTDDNILYLGPAQPEGAPYVASQVALGDRMQNVCQIWEYTWSSTHRGRIRPSDEVQTDRFRYEQKKKMVEAVRDLDLAFLFGSYNVGDGTGLNPSSFSGLVEATAANVNVVSGALELIDILDGLQDVATDVGRGSMGKTLLEGYKEKRILNSLFKQNRRYPGSGDVKMQEDGFDSDFGHIKFKTHKHLTNTARLILCNESDWDFRWFEGGQWSDGMYTTDGWFDTGFLRADLGPIWPGDRRRAQWTSFSVADADYPNLDII